MSILQSIVTNFSSSKKYIQYIIQTSATENIRWNLRGYGILIFSYFLLPGFVSLPFLFVVREGHLEYDILLQYSVVVSGVLISYWYLRTTKRYDGFVSLGPQKIKNLILTLTILSLVVLLRTIAMAPYNGIGLDIVSKAIDSSTVILFGVIGLVIIKPVAEELFFRGVLQNHLRLSLTPSVSITVASVTNVIFIIIPLHHGGLSHSIILFAILLFQYVLLGYLHDTSGSLIYNILTHVLIQIFIVLLFL
jgi:membrane protease YdiL (CAAX protease family)